MSALSALEVAMKPYAVMLGVKPCHAIYNEDARYTLRRLSAAAKQFLDTGDPESIKQHGLFM